MIPKSGSRLSGKIMLKQKTGAGCRLEEKSSGSSERPSFDAHLRARNAERLQFASWYFAAVMLALVAAELVVPVLWSTVMIVVQVISAVYFCGLAWVCRTERVATWPTQAMPLLFGAARSRPDFSFHSTSRRVSAPPRPMRRRSSSPAWRRCGPAARCCHFLSLFTASISGRFSPAPSTAFSGLS